MNTMIEASFFSFFIVMLVAVLFSTFFGRLHVPWAIALIGGGIVVGPYGLGLFTPADTLVFMGEIGLVFLMFMAGLEMRFGALKERAGSISSVAIINGAIPFAVGIGICLWFGFPWTTAFLVGIIFVSSSVAVVVPPLASSGLLGTSIGNVIIGSTMIQDIASLLLLSIFFQTSTELTSLPLPVFYLLLFLCLIILRWIIPRIELFFAQTDTFQQELRSVFVVLVGTVVIFQFLGLHPIIAGFFAGMVLADQLRSQIIREKIATVSYGVFIPIFFIIIGTQTNIHVFRDVDRALVFTAVLVGGSLVAKLASGWIAGRLARFSQQDSLLIAVTSVPQLSTTLAVASSGFMLGIISADVMTALVALTIITTFSASLMMTPLLSRRAIREAQTSTDPQKV